MKISVLTPSYNSGKYIERAIQSVIDQNYENYEHIIMDGGSTDDTLSIINKYNHLKYVSKPDKGQSDAMNGAFKMSSGDIIVYLNADDEFASNAFKNVIMQFTNFPKADIILGNLIFTGPEGTLTRIPSPKYLDIVQYWSNKFPNNPVSYFYKRHVQAAIGDFHIDDHFSMDIWFLLKAYKRFNVVKIDAILGTFHSDGNNKTASADVGINLHTTIKEHLKAGNPLILIYFYYKFILAKIKH